LARWLVVGCNSTNPSSGHGTRSPGPLRRRSGRCGGTAHGCQRQSRALRSGAGWDRLCWHGWSILIRYSPSTA